MATCARSPWCRGFDSFAGHLQDKSTGSQIAVMTASDASDTVDHA